MRHPKYEGREAYWQYGNTICMTTIHADNYDVVFNSYIVVARKYKQSPATLALNETRDKVEQIYKHLGLNEGGDNQ